MRFIFTLGISLLSFALYPQVGINTTLPSQHAALDINAEATDGSFKGFIPPRVPTEMDKMSINPGPDEAGLMVYVEESGCIEIWNSSQWNKIHCEGGEVYATDLFFSEYLEGVSGNNKALEIANFTGADIALEAYSIEGYHNAATTVNYTFSLPAQILPHGEVFVIVNSQSNVDPELVDLADFRAGINFNGNDAVVLKKNTAIIDILGKIGEDRSFGTDVILRRLSHYGPSTIYYPEQFILDDPRDYSGLGWHNFYN